MAFLDRIGREKKETKKDSKKTLRRLKVKC
jgi:hypothetical protein